MAAARRLLPSPAALGHGAEVPGRLRAHGRAAARPHRRGRGGAAPRAGRDPLPEADHERHRRPALVRAACRRPLRRELPRRGAARRRRPGPRQPDRRAHRLQRRLRAADGDRPRGRGRLPAAARPACCAPTRSRTARRRRLRLDSLAAPGGQDWFSYVAGVVWAFASEGLPVRGIDVVVDGDVPIGAGLSSSAALELATARALAAATGAPWDPVRMARLGQTRGERATSA